MGASLNGALVAAQVAVGLWSDSVALLADAVHNAGDVLGLVAAWGAYWLARRRPTARHTYGLGRSGILAALFNAVLLLMGSGAILWESLLRLAHPSPVVGWPVIAAALLGILVNGGSALLFQGGHSDVNRRAAFLHLVADCAVSAGVVLAALGIVLTGWLWLDPAASLVISIVIVVGTWGLLREGVALALDAVPAGIDLAQVERALAALPGVHGVHHVHIWALGADRTALTAHLVADAVQPDLAAQGVSLLRERFGIAHATLQVETDETARRCAPCAEAA